MKKFLSAVLLFAFLVSTFAHPIRAESSVKILKLTQEQTVSLADLTSVCAEIGTVSDASLYLNGRLQSLCPAIENGICTFTGITPCLGVTDITVAAETGSDTVTVFVEGSVESLKGENDFEAANENTANTVTLNGASLSRAVVPDTENTTKALCLTPKEGASAPYTMTRSCDAGINILSFDLYLFEGSRFSVMIRGKGTTSQDSTTNLSGDSATGLLTLSNGKTDKETVPFTGNRWNSFVFQTDTVNSKIWIYLNGELLCTEEGLDYVTKLSEPSARSIRLTLAGTNGGAIDNFRHAYIGSLPTLTESRAENNTLVFETSEPFTNVLAENAKLYCADADVPISSVSCDGAVITVEADGQLFSGTKYYFVLSDLKNSGGAFVGADYSFPVFYDYGSPDVESVTYTENIVTAKMVGSGNACMMITQKDERGAIISVTAKNITVDPEHEFVAELPSCGKKITVFFLTGLDNLSLLSNKIYTFTSKGGSEQ